MNGVASGSPGYTNEPMERIRARFGPGVEAEVSIGSGWWEMLRELDDDLAALEPGYQVVQVQEKMGALRYHLYYPDHTQLMCCGEFAKNHPDDGDPAWEIHEKGAEHRMIFATVLRGISATEGRRVMMEEVIRSYEKRSETTCSTCGSLVAGGHAH
jgi:hypothetical protein